MNTLSLLRYWYIVDKNCFHCTTLTWRVEHIRDCIRSDNRWPTLSICLLDSVKPESTLLWRCLMGPGKGHFSSHKWLDWSCVPKTGNQMNQHTHNLQHCTATSHTSLKQDIHWDMTWKYWAMTYLLGYDMEVLGHDIATGMWHHATTSAAYESYSPDLHHSVCNPC